MWNIYKITKYVFKEEELKDVILYYRFRFYKTSYKQISLVEFDENYSLDQRTEKSGTRWDNTVAKGNPKADERFFRKDIKMFQIILTMY